jgi:hypothetical protein
MCAMAMPAPTTWGSRPTLQPLFRFRSQQVHRLFALRARLRRGAGHARADHRRARLCLQGQRRAGGRRFPVQRMRQLRRLRAGLPDRDLQEKAVKDIGKPERAVVTTCAYCGVGCTFRAEMRGEQLVRMVPWKDGKANRGHSCVKGRFAWGYANHQDRITEADDPRQRSTIRGAKVSWDEALASPPAAERDQGRHGARALGGITSSRCTNEEVPRAEAGPLRLRFEQCRYLRPRLPFADRLWPVQDLRHQCRHAGFRQRDGRRRHPGDRRQPDRRPPRVRQPDEAPAAAGREADRDRPAPDRPGPLARISRRRITCRSSPAPMSRC